MPVAKLTLELEIPHAQSLKDRRQVVRSVRDSLRHGFNISIAEADPGTLWNLATLEVVAVSASIGYLTGQLKAVERAATRHATRLGALLTDVYAELLNESSDSYLELPHDLTEADVGALSVGRKL